MRESRGCSLLTGCNQLNGGSLYTWTFIAGSSCSRLYQARQSRESVGTPLSLQPDHRTWLALAFVAKFMEVAITTKHGSTRGSTVMSMSCVAQFHATFYMLRRWNRDATNTLYEGVQRILYFVLQLLALAVGSLLNPTGRISHRTRDDKPRNLASRQVSWVTKRHGYETAKLYPEGALQFRQNFLCRLRVQFLNKKTENFKIQRWPKRFSQDLLRACPGCLVVNGSTQRHFPITVHA